MCDASSCRVYWCDAGPDTLFATSAALSHSPVRQDAIDGDGRAMEEIADDVSKLRAVTPAEECDGDNGDVELNLLLNALTLDQRQRADEMNMEIMQLADAMGG